MSAELSDQPLEEGLRRLFRGYNLVIYYDSPSRDAHRGGSARLSEVRIFTGADPHAQAIVFAPPFPNANAQGATVPAAHRASSDPKEAFPAERTSDRAVIESLSETLLSNNDSSVRAGAAEALGKTWDEGAVVPLSQSLADDPSSAVREAAARALGRTWSERAVPALSEALMSDRDARVREQAARALAQTAGEEAVEALARALVNDPRLFVRDAAAEALGTIGGRGAMDALSQAAVRDPDAWVRETAAEAALNSLQ
jgi:HEAT repeat protein